MPASTPSRRLPSPCRPQSLDAAFAEPVRTLDGAAGPIAVRDGLLCFRRIHVDHGRESILLRHFAQEDLFAAGHETLNRIGILSVLSLLLLNITIGLLLVVVVVVVVVISNRNNESPWTK